MNYNNLIKNGLYLPFVSLLIYLFLDDIHLSIFFFLKAFSINYFFHYDYLYPKPNIYRWKHIARLTDTGHIASFMFYFNKNTIPLAHNIHFVIDSGFFITKLFFKMNDTDTIDKSNYINSHVMKIHEYLNHSIGYIIIVHYMLNNNNINYEFNNTSLLLTFLWLYVWLFFIYVPWVLITNDYLYNILEPSKPLYFRLSMILFINLLAYISNYVGKFIQFITFFHELSGI